jgi:23S rRNA (cytidine1920-2'-O)/16S rRNA (cytidine1409-2'-O)-methyltransferase
MKKRLDQLLAERYSNLSKTYIQSLIMQRKVKVEDKIVDKAGTQISDNANITVDLTEPKYVSRAGYKLEKALDHFNVDVKDFIVLDAGLSTGGFADCLLQHGAKKIYGIDVGYGQVHEKIRNDPRVIVMERTNVRYLESLPELVDLVTLDLSFISVLKVMSAVVKLLKPRGKLIILIKPQFESEKGQVGKGGIITDSKLQESIIKKVVDGIDQYGFISKGIVESPILGTEGNKEFLAYFER